MPNHVENDLFIDGTTSQVDEVLATIGAKRDTPTFDFNTLIPYPEPWAQMDKESCAMQEIKDKAEQRKAIEAYFAKWGTHNDGFNSGGHDWCVATWGTKWNAYEVVIVTDRVRDYSDKKRVRVSFRTAWSAPIPVVDKLAELYPDVEIALEYFEKGMEFAGGSDYIERQYVEAGEQRKSEWSIDNYKGCRGG